MYVETKVFDERQDELFIRRMREGCGCRQGKNIYMHVPYSHHNRKAGQTTANNL